MPYFVKWTTVAFQDEVAEHPQSYVELADAMDFACAVLACNPTEIWVEDENGDVKAMDFRIRQHCRAKGGA
jgi:hypothetical protein